MGFRWGFQYIKGWDNKKDGGLLKKGGGEGLSIQDLSQKDKKLDKDENIPDKNSITVLSW